MRRHHALTVARVVGRRVSRAEGRTRGLERRVLIRRSQSHARCEGGRPSVRNEYGGRLNIPEALAPLFDEGIIDRVVRPLMSGKEAQVFLVECGGELRVAKVYKNADHRSFKKRGDYTQGRKTRNSRDQRAVEKRSKHGRAEEEAAWKSAEVDIIHRLHIGGVRVPIPHAFVEGVLIMECVVDPDGNPAPRLGDLAFDAEGAKAMYDRVMQEVVRMLAVGVVHGDLSDFNVLVSGDEPILIDFPQSVDTASNTNARKLLLRDVDNIHRFLARWAPKLPRLPYAEEMWALHENNALTADTVLTGRFRETVRATSGDSVIGLIRDAERDERKRVEALGGARSMPFDVRRPVPSSPSPRASTPSAPSAAPSSARPSNARPAPRSSSDRSGPSNRDSSSRPSNRDSSSRDRRRP